MSALHCPSRRVFAALLVATLVAHAPGCGLGVTTALLLSPSEGGRGGGGPTPEPVFVLSPSAVTNDRVLVQYTLRDPSVIAFDVRVEYSTGGESGSFSTAREAAGSPSEGTAALAVSPSGTPHVFVWNSFADLDPQGITDSRQVVVRVTAVPVGATAGASYGLPGRTQPFAVDNRLTATVAGPSATTGDFVPALETPLEGPTVALPGPRGELLIADAGNARVRRRDPTTHLSTTVLGTGSPGAGAPGSPAVATAISSPRGLAADAAGNLFVCDTGNHRVLRVDAGTGLVTVIAGTGTPGYSGDAGAATLAQLRGPEGLVVTATGALLVCDTGNHVVRRVLPGGGISTAAGIGTPGSAGDGGPAIAAALSSPRAIALDPQGRVFVADAGNHAVRRFTLGGSLVTVAGSLGVAGRGADGGALSSALDSPSGVVVQGDGAVVVADTGNHRVRRVAVDGSTIATIAGRQDGQPGFAGDNGAATAAALRGPLQLGLDDQGTLVVADAGNNRVRRIDPAGTISTVFGSGAADPGNVGDGGLATEAQLFETAQMDVAPDGTVYVADGNGGHRVRRFTIGGTISTVIGDGVPGSTGDGGLASRARVDGPYGLAVDADGILFVGEEGGARLRAVNPVSGIITTVAGAGVLGTTFGGIEALRVVPPAFVTQAGRRQLLIVDTFSHQLQRLTYDVDPVTLEVLNGEVDTVAGTGAEGYSGDGGAALAAELALPFGADFDATGNIIFLDQFAAVVRKIDPAGDISTIAGDNTCDYGGDGGSALVAAFCAFYLSIDRPAGLVYLTDFSNNRVRRFVEGGNIETVAGTGGSGDVGSGLPALQTPLPLNTGIALLSDGSILTGAQGTKRIYRFLPGGTATVVAGRAAGANVGDGGQATVAVVRQPRTALAPDGTLFVAESRFGLIRRVDPLTGVITTLAGKGVLGTDGNEGPLAEALIDTVSGLAVSPDGRSLYLAERDQSLVRRIDLVTGTIHSFAGRGPSATSDGDGGPAVLAGLQGPVDVAVGADGAVFVVDTFAQLVRRIGVDGTISTVAGGGADLSDGVPAVSADLPNPQGIAVDAQGNVFVSTGDLVRRFTPGGAITTVAGNGVAGFNGDNIPATEAQLDGPDGLSVDAAGNLYICDVRNQRVRRVDPQGFISTVAGTGDEGSGPDRVPGPLTRLNGPVRVTVDPRGNIYVAESFGSRVRRLRPFP